MPSDAAQGTSRELSTSQQNTSDTSAQDALAYPQFRLSSPSFGKCLKCDKAPREGRKLRICKGCSMARYCNSDCQKADWPLHRKVCRSKREPASNYVLGMTPFQQIHALSLWSEAHQWTLERIARTAICLAGGIDRFLRARSIFYVTLRFNEELKEEPRFDKANLFRVTTSVLVPLDMLPAHIRRSLSAWEREDLEKRRAAGCADVDDAGVVARLPIMYQLGQTGEPTGSITKFLPLRRFRREGALDERARKPLEDFDTLCKLMVNHGLPLQSLQPGDAVAFPHATLANWESVLSFPLFASWKSTLGVDFAAGAVGDLDPEALMRAYAALE